MENNEIENSEIEVQVDKKWQTKILVVGAVSGALVGLAAAYLLVMNTEKKGEKFEVTLAEGIRIGLLAIGVVRSVARL